MDKKLIILVVLLALLCPSLCVAMCVYNESDDNIQATFFCGVGCAHVWVITPKEKRCVPGKGGTIEFISDTRMNHVKVDEHGWVKFTGSQVKLVACSYDKDGSEKECNKH